MAATSFQAGANSGLTWSSRSLINSPADGVIRLTNNAVNGFDRLQFGGITASFAAIKRNGTGIDIRDAADVGFTDLRARNITATGPITFPSITSAGLTGYSASSYTGAMVFVPDDVDGPTMAFSDGTNWLRVRDNVPIS
jgi:hypothetical protein